MKILLVTNLPMVHYAGTENILSLFAARLIESGHDFSFLNLLLKQECPTRENWRPPFSTYPERVSVVTVHELPRRFSMLVMRWRQMWYGKIDYGTYEIKKEIDKNGDYDIIIIEHFIWISGAKIAIKSSNTKAKLIFWNHGSIADIKRNNSIRDKLRSFLAKPLLEKWLSDADVALAISKGIADEISRYAPFLDIRIIYNPVRMNDLKKIRASSTPIFLYVGRVDNYSKNLNFMLKGLKKTGRRDWRLVVVGDGPDSDSLKKYADLLGLTSNIDWRGYLTNPFEAVEEATCLLLTSKYEGFSLVLVEAIARGLPVIAANCPMGPIEVVIPGRNGYLFKPEDIDEFVSFLQKALQGNMGLPSRDEISKTVEKYDANIILKDIEKICLEIAQ